VDVHTNNIMGRRRRRRRHHKSSEGTPIRFFSKLFFSYIVGSIFLYSNYYVETYLDGHGTIESLTIALSKTFILLTPVETGISHFFFYTFISIVIGFIILVFTWDGDRYIES